MLLYLNIQIASPSYAKQLGREEQLILARDMPRSLLEAAHLLAGDMFSPEDLAESEKVLRDTLSKSDIVMLEEEIKAKYYGYFYSECLF